MHMTLSLVSGASLGAGLMDFGLGLLVRSATNQEFARLLNLKIGSIGEI